ncbi:hypothetical protein KSP39_PZI020743 [Platanthera zijinensis]|uniref:Uncharacterized protein n=1 Tax=Platanthera zijinensis TaxID=2320716 RepID=A0AAP0AZT2_9ASPA
MVIVMKQQNRTKEVIEVNKCLRSGCTDQSQESLNSILLDLFQDMGICMMKQGKVTETNATLKQVRPGDDFRGGDSHLKVFDRAQEMLHDLKTKMWLNQARLFDALLSTSSIWRPQPYTDHHLSHESFEE